MFPNQIHITCTHQPRDYFINMMAVNDKASRKANEVSGVASLWRRE